MSTAVSDFENETILAEIEALAIEASNAAVTETLARGVGVFYRERDVLVREDVGGQRFEVRHTPLKRSAYDVIRELE